MWGVGRATQEALGRLNIHTFEALRSAPVDLLVKTLGKNGARIHQLATGLDQRDVVVAREAKSIGHEQTFVKDIIDRDESRKALLTLAEKVGHRLRTKGMKGKTLSLKVKYSDFKQVTRASTLKHPTDDGFQIYTTACALLEKTDAGKRPVRLLGISLSGLDSATGPDQQELFERDAPRRGRGRVNLAMDRIMEKHGERSVRPGTLYSDGEHQR
jgi:DNA polymerase-4